MFKKAKKLPEVVGITSPAINSMLGKYFIGQTGTMNFGNNSYAWGGIINPNKSGVNLYIDLFTITNFSQQNFTGEIWLNTETPKKSVVSSTVTPSNQTVSLSSRPKAIMKYADHLTESPIKGINIFDRIVAPNSTIISDSHQGSIIIGPGGSFSILLKSPGAQNITGTIVITWWEDKI
jgi:hypothetical protein